MVDGVPPSHALASLCESLGEYGIQTAGMDLSQSDGLLFTTRGTANGKAVGYACGLYWWQSGRRRHDRPIYAIHPATDPRGAARRVVRTWRAQRAAGDRP